MDDRTLLLSLPTVDVATTAGQAHLGIQPAGGFPRTRPIRFNLGRPKSVPPAYSLYRPIDIRLIIGTGVLGRIDAQLSVKDAVAVAVEIRPCATYAKVVATASASGHHEESVALLAVFLVICPSAGFLLDFAADKVRRLLRWR